MRGSGFGCNFLISVDRQARTTLNIRPVVLAGTGVPPPSDLALFFIVQWFFGILGRRFAVRAGDTLAPCLALLYFCGGAIFR